MTAVAKAFAPASIGNVGVGFDMLGLAIAGAGDTVIATRNGGNDVSICGIFDSEGQPHTQLPSDADANTASIAAAALWKAQQQRGGVELAVHKGIPLQSGMGSSAASAVAAAVAVNALLDKPLPTGQLLPYAMEGEKFASGGLHADNVAPSLLGGLVLCPSVLLPSMIAISTPDGISSVLLHAELQINTAESRKSLATDCSIQQWLTQQGYLAGFIAACEQNDHDLLRRCLRDVIVEPQRSGHLPYFDKVKEAALSFGALGCSLSGSGPSMFAFALENDAQQVATAMQAACEARGYRSEYWISPLDAPGATVVPVE